MPLLLVAAILAANSAGRNPAPQPTGQVPAAPAAAVTVRLEVENASVAPGQPVTAQLYAVNHTNRRLPVNCDSATWPLLELTGRGLPAQGVDPVIACPQSGLPPGASTFSLSVPTAYGECAAGSRGAAGGPTPCRPGPAVDALPPGFYRLRAVAGALPAGSSLPAPVVIKVR